MPGIWQKWFRIFLATWFNRLLGILRVGIVSPWIIKWSFLKNFPGKNSYKICKNFGSSLPENPGKFHRKNACHNSVKFVTIAQMQFFCIKEFGHFSPDLLIPDSGYGDRWPDLAGYALRWLTMATNAHDAHDGFGGLRWLKIRSKMSKSWNGFRNSEGNFFA